MAAGMDGVEFLRMDMCSLGMTVVGDGLNLKPKGSLTNHPGVLRALAHRRCTKDHVHEPLTSGLPQLAQVYPVDVVSTLIRGVRTPPPEKESRSRETHDVDPAFPAVEGLDEFLARRESGSFTAFDDKGQRAMATRAPQKD